MRRTKRPIPRKREIVHLRVGPVSVLVDARDCLDSAARVAAQLPHLAYVSLRHEQEYLQVDGSGRTYTYEEFVWTCEDPRNFPARRRSA